MDLGWERSDCVYRWRGRSQGRGERKREKEGEEEGKREKIEKILEKESIIGHGPKRAGH